MSPITNHILQRSVESKSTVFFTVGKSTAGVSINGKYTELSAPIVSPLIQLNFNDDVWDKIIIQMKNTNLTFDKIVYAAFKKKEISKTVVTMMAYLVARCGANHMRSYLYKQAQKCFENNAIYHRTIKAYIGLTNHSVLRTANHPDAINTYKQDFLSMVECICVKCEQKLTYFSIIYNSSNKTFTVMYKSVTHTIRSVHTRDIFLYQASTIEMALNMLEKNSDHKSIEQKTKLPLEILIILGTNFFPKNLLIYAKNTYKQAILKNDQLYINMILKLKMDLSISRLKNIYGEKFIIGLLSLLCQMRRIQIRVYRKVNFQLLSKPISKFSLGMIYKGSFSSKEYHIYWHKKPLNIEFKTYLWKIEHKLSPLRQAQVLNGFFNHLLTKYPSVNSMKDITHAQIENTLHVTGVTLHDIKLSPFITFLQNYSLLDEKSPYGNLPPAPLENICTSFKVIYNRGNNHLPLPEIVYQQIYSKLHTVSEIIHNAFLIMAATGCRADELEYMYEDSLQWNEKESIYELTFYISKQAKSLTKKGKKAIRIVPIIDQEVVEAYKHQSTNTKEIRKISNIKSIFVRKNQSEQYSVIDASFIRNKINKLINTHKIKDEAGSIWHYGTHQMRAMVVTKLVEMGHTSEQITAFMKWQTDTQINTAYAIIRNKRMMDITSDFFHEHFHTEIPDKALNKLTLVERKSLFVELYVNYRQMEYGRCVRHPILGECGKLQMPSNCASCPKLISSKEYLPKWYKFKDNQENIINKLIENFEKEGITNDNYQEWAEYQREQYIYNAYISVIENLERT